MNTIRRMSRCATLRCFGLAAASLLFFLLAPPARADGPTFGEPSLFGTGKDLTLSVAVGDMNGDGLLDIVTGYYTGTNAVYFNNPRSAGEFYLGWMDCDDPPDEARCFGTAWNMTYGVAVGDMDGDGDLDIVAGNTSRQSAVYLNDGRGNFLSSRPFGDGSELIRDVALGDVDGDGDLDIVAGMIGAAGQPNLVYINQSGYFGTAYFPDPVRPFGDGSNTHSVAVGDMDGDGDLDIVAGHSGGASTIHLNDGTGHFDVTRTAGSGGVGMSRVTVGDMDGDGDLDIVESNGGGLATQNMVYLNDGAAHFSSWVDCNDPSTNGRCFGPGVEQTYDVAVGDVDGDGDLDIAVANDRQPNVVYLNDGRSNFYTGTVNCDSLPANARCFGTGTDRTAGLAVADLDGDGDLDLVAGNGGDGGSGELNVVYLNDGGGRFSDGVKDYGPPLISYVRRIVVGDVDGDGDNDIATNEGLLYLNSGAGNFYSGQVNYDDPPADVRLFGLGLPVGMALGDVDGDGNLDLAVSGDGLPNRVYLNDGAGHFYRGGMTTTLPCDNSAGVRCFGSGSESANAIAMGDMDGDGDLDLVTAQAGGEGRYDLIFMNGPQAGGGSGAGYFYVGAVDCENPPQNVRCFGAAYRGDDTESLAIGDVDGDGDLDIVTGNAYQQNLVYLNDGDGSFYQARPSDTLDCDEPPDGVSCIGSDVDATESLALGDVDGDSDLDIVVGNYDQINEIYLNDGSGHFDEDDSRYVSLAADSTTSVALGDVDGDGDLDLAVGNLDQRGVVYLNNGSGAFNASSARFFGASSDATYSVALADMDGDGALDVVTGNYGPQSHLYLNRLGRVERMANTPPYVAMAYPGAATSADPYFTPDILDKRFISVTYSLFDMEGDPVDRVVASYSPDGGGHWLPAVAAPGTITRNLSTGGRAAYFDDFTSRALGDGAVTQAPLMVTRAYEIGDLDVWVHISHTTDSDLVASLRSPAGTSVRLFTGVGNGFANFDHTLLSDQASISIASTPVLAPFAGVYRPEGRLADLNGQMSNGAWSLIITDTNANGESGRLLGWGIRIKTPPATHVFNWDTFASGFFGRSDNVVFRVRAYPGLRPYANATPGAYQQPYAAGQTLFFRVRGSQVRVISGTLPAEDALVYRIPAGQSRGSAFADPSGQPYQTDHLGYLQGRGQMGLGDRLVALLPISTGPLSYWKFDEGGGEAVTDTANYAGPGLLANGPAFTTTVPVSITFFDPYALQFDGLDDYVEVPDPPDFGLGTEGFALSLWFRKDAAGVRGDLVSWKNDQDEVALFSQADEKLALHIKMDGVVQCAGGGSPPLATGVWHRVAVVRETAATIKLYVDGSAPVSYTCNPGLDMDDMDKDTPLWFGANNAGGSHEHAFLGLMDDVRLYRRALSAAEVAGLAHVDQTDATSPYRLYYTNAAPTLAGLRAYTITAPGVQTLSVSPEHPLLLFDLNVSLQWDAYDDESFMSRLKFDFQRASEILYDWTDGQAALGEVTIYHDRAHWNDAHVRVYASNRLRPSAVRGGIVGTILADTDAISVTYAPGQVHMGAVWNRYGEPGGELGEDWPRTLAHELGHYAFFLDDNYIGLDATGRLIPVDGCPGAMSDPYRKDYPYDEFHPDAGWLPACEQTLSNRSAGRSDWGTITAHYAWLKGTAANPGPSSLPLAVTRITSLEPITPGLTLEEPTFYMSEQGKRIQPGARARAFLFQAGWAIDLGKPTLDRVLARGARPGDRVCVYEPAAERLGCETVSLGDEQLEMVTWPGWKPEILIGPVTSRTIVLTVTNVPTGLAMGARLFPLTGPAGAAISLTTTSGGYRGTFHTQEPAMLGYVHVWVGEGEPRREMVTDYALGGNPGFIRGNQGFIRGNQGFIRGNQGFIRGNQAPAMSADGQVILFGDGLDFAPGEFFTLQAATTIPSAPPWVTVVGQAYRLSATAHAPSLDKASISFTYMGSDVPTGEEDWLRLYYRAPLSDTWRQLPTTLDTYYNSASATAQGVGLYALMASFEVPLRGSGWNMFSYPVLATRPVTRALLSIDGYYSLVYGHQAADLSDPWKVYGVAAPVWVNDLHELEYGHGYWINVSRPITVYLKGGQAAALSGAQAAASFPTPPTTFYGAVRADAGFTPTAGMMVTAWIAGARCGQGKTLDVAGQIVYVVDVLADDGAGAAGCGVPGRMVRFQVGTYTMQTAAAWDNSRLWELDLDRQARPIYLPLVIRGG